MIGPISPGDAVGCVFLHAIEINRPEWNGWPCTITSTRYGGSYEHGAWAAFPVEPADLIDADWASGDCEADEWWECVRRMDLPIGIGATPEAALGDLERRMEARKASTTTIA